MNDFLFYALLIALVYYFMIYLPKQKSQPNSQSPRPQTSQPPFRPRPKVAHEPPLDDEPGTVNFPGPEQVFHCPSPTILGPDAIPDPELKKLHDQNQTLLKDQTQKEQTIIGLNRSYENEVSARQKLEQKTKNLQQQLTQAQNQNQNLNQNLTTQKNSTGTQITELKQQLTSLQTQLTQLTSTHQQDQHDLETFLDKLIREMHELENSLN